MMVISGVSWMTREGVQRVSNTYGGYMFLKNYYLNYTYSNLFNFYICDI